MKKHIPEILLALAGAPFLIYFVVSLYGWMFFGVDVDVNRVVVSLFFATLLDGTALFTYLTKKAYYES